MLERNRIYNMDCVAGMKLLDDGSIDLTVTSPPYDNLRMYNGYSFDFDAVATELFRVTKDGGVMVWVVNDATVKGSETGTSFRQALRFKEIGFLLHDTMVYLKDSCPYPEILCLFNPITDTSPYFRGNEGIYCKPLHQHRNVVLLLLQMLRKNIHLHHVGFQMADDTMDIHQ